MSDVMRYLGRDPDSGGCRSWLKKRIKKINIDTSHFKSRCLSDYDTSDILTKNSRRGRNTVRGYILREKLIPYQCAFCGNTGEWLGKTMSLELDHINGINDDHRLENLRFLCPNCHATTDTYCNKNNRNKIEF